MIKEFTTYIANATGKVIDTDLFAGFRPPNSPDRCVVVLENTGGAVDSYLPDTGDKAVQVLTRASSYWDARDDAYEIFEYLASKAQVELPEVTEGVVFTAQFIEANHYPQSLQQDEKGRYEFSTNFTVRLRKH